MSSALERQHVNVLWTGGMDSSFTMIKLSRCNVEIQPYYLCDNRDSEKFELNAIAQITDDIEKHPETRCIMLPLIKLSTSEIEKDSSITSAYERLSRTTKIGSQYDWLARFAKTTEGLELSLEKSDNSKALSCIMKYGDVKRIDDGEVHYYVLDEAKSTEDLIKVFGGLRFSLVWDYMKEEEVEEFKKLGFEESHKKTWFCFTPINGKPCGSCNPCKTAIGDGMAWRFDKDALKRYKLARIKRYFRPLKKIIPENILNRLKRMVERA
jgi:7-cyano-7-deazaguanine synthase